MDATFDLDGAVLSFRVVPLLDVVNDRSRCEGIAVRNLREVAEQVVATGIGLDKAESLLVPALGSSLLVASRWWTSDAAAATSWCAAAAAKAATTAANTAFLLWRSTGHLLGTLLALAIVVHFHELHGRALLEHFPILDRREVAEEVFTPIVWLDEAKALRVPATRDAGGLAAAATTLGRTTTLAIPHCPLIESEIGRAHV